MWPHDAELHAWWVEPGRLLAGEYPGGPRTTARLDLLIDAGIRTFVDLTAPADGLDDYSPLLRQAADARDLALSHARYPISDFGVTTERGYDAILSAIDDGLARGAVYVHCWGGVGRTGTVIGCWLIDGGLSSTAALDRLAELRADSRMAHRAAPEAEAQRDVLRRRAQRPR